MSDPDLDPGSERTHPGDGLLGFAMAVLAMLLGCYELFDADVWWHLRSGQWILEHRRVPRVDLFSFSSADRPWVDLHWGFQVALALAHAAGGVPGMILLGATASASAFTIALTARRPDWPAWAVALCWLPALALMATRFDPRPEVFSLVYLAGFLAVLLHVNRRPALAWALPPIEVLWVNTHGLFILGPIVLGCYWLDRGVRAWGGSARSRGEGGPAAERPHAWRHLAPASAAVALVLLANPYGVRGTLLPLELLPKIADPSNPYKSYVDEFAGLRTAVRDRMLDAPGIHLYIRIQVFLLLMLPWSFLLPAAWQGWRSSPGRPGWTGPAAPWAVGLATATGLALAAALGLPLLATPPRLAAIGRWMPAAMLVAGSCAAAVLAVRSRTASAMMVSGSAASAAWAAWLRADLFRQDPGMPAAIAAALPHAAAGLGVLAAALVLRLGGSLFRLLLASAFTYLAFQAVRNTNLFGLVAGTVLAWNLGEWAAGLAAARPPGRRRRTVSLAVDLLLSGLVVLWCVGVATDRYYALAGEDIHFGLRERPLTFAHEAARFAGRDGLPRRALAFHLGQAAVYIHHNAPERKVFMDGRLEVPSLSTFQTYVRIEDWLNRGDARWDDAVRRMGDPLILISHRGWSDAEATLLAHPRWRCVDFDALASVFVPRQGPSSSPGFPDFDFIAAHFSSHPAESGPAEPGRTIAEAEALLRLASVLRRRGVDPWRLRIPMLTRASDLARAWLAGGAADPAPWRLLGFIEWEKASGPRRRPPGPADAWDPAAGLAWARATHCFRRALEVAPGDLPTSRALAACLGVRRITDDRRDAESPPARADRRAGTLEPATDPAARPRGSTWSQANRIAAIRMHLGDPHAARRAWAEAADPPSTALRLTRMAGADLAALDLEAADAGCRHALNLDPNLGEAWYVLAATLFDAGRAGEALAACREGLNRFLSDPQRAALLDIEGLLGGRR